MTAVAHPAKIQRRNRATAGAILLLMAFELLWLAFEWQGFRIAAFAAMLSVVPLSAHRLGLREAYLLTFCITLTVFLYRTHPDPLGAAYQALEQAAFLMAFILLIGLIQQAATTSDAIRDCGTYLTRQPPGRRYLAIFGGTHLMANLFNLGVVSLLAPLIKRGTEGNDPLNPLREQRQINAMLRGFAWCVIWSPTAVAPLVLLTLLPDARRAPWMLAGIVIALAVMLAGYLEDRWQWRAYHPRPGRTAPMFPARAYGDLAMVCGALIGLTLGVMTLSGGSVMFGLMTASPIILVCWLFIQKAGDGGAVKGRLGEIVFGHLPAAAPLAVTLACSGYIGRAAAALVPAAEWAEALGLETWPGWLFLLMLSVGVAALSQFALSPIMMAVFFGSLIAAVPELPADITWTALAISCGWALSMTISPFATVVLMIAQATGHTGREMTWHWNGRFSLITVGILAIAFWWLA